MDIANLSLPPELEEFVSGALASGKYSTQGDLLREALLLLRDRERVREARLQDLRQELQIGLDESARGESEPFDVEEIKGEVRQQLVTRRPGSR